MKEPSGEIINQAEDLPPTAFATGLDDRLVSASRPRVGKCPPLRKARFISKQQQRFFRARLPHNLRPHAAAEALPCDFIQVIRDERAVLRELFLDVKGHRATSNHAARWKSEATNFT